MELIRPAMAGTLESSDVLVTVSPQPGQGIAIELESEVKELFGEAIEAAVRRVLDRLDVKDARVELQDRGALDCVIEARLACAVCRGAQCAYDWREEDGVCGN